MSHRVHAAICSKYSSCCNDTEPKTSCSLAYLAINLSNTDNLFLEAFTELFGPNIVENILAVSTFQSAKPYSAPIVLHDCITERCNRADWFAGGTDVPQDGPFGVAE